MLAAPPFSIGRYRFTLTPNPALRAPALNKGNMLRGAFGYAFKAMACCAGRLQSGDPCRERCQANHACPYGLLFESAPPRESDRLRLNQDIPRPFVMKPPLACRTHYDATTPLVFDVVLVGRGLEYLSYFVLAFRELGLRGIGSPDARGRRGTAILERVDAVHDDGSTDAVYRASSNELRNVRSSLAFDVVPIPSIERQERVRIRFVTPTILKSDGRIVDRPTFGDVIRRLRDRVNALASFHGSGPLNLDFRGLADRADAIRTVASDVRWESRSRLSSKRHVQHDLSGVVGWIEYEGALDEFMPWLRIGELIHVGKNATFGNGWIDVERIAAAG